MKSDQPNIKAAESRDGFRVAVTWARGRRAGLTDVIDLAASINGYKLFRPLRADRQRFEGVRPVDYGWAIAWPERDEDEYLMDIGADTLERMAIKQSADNRN